MTTLATLEHVELVFLNERGLLSEAEEVEKGEAIALKLLLSLPASVRHLSLAGLEALTTSICAALASRASLQALSLRGIPNISMEQMVALVGSVGGLARLQMFACKGFGLQQCKGLERGYGGLALRVEWEEYDVTHWDSV